MSDQLASDKSRPPMYEGRLSRLVDVWGPELTPAEFKLAASIYRAIEQNGGSDVRMTARELAETACLSERFAETARKKLSAKGIIHLEMRSTGSWCGFPRDTGAPESPIPETAADEPSAPTAAPECSPAPSAGLDIQGDVTAAALNAAGLVPTVPGGCLPDLAAAPNPAASDPAIGAPASANPVDLAAAAGPAQNAGPKIGAERTRPATQVLSSARHAPAIGAGVLAPPAAGSAAAEPDVQPELSAVGPRSRLSVESVAAASAGADCRIAEPDGAETPEPDVQPEVRAAVRQNSLSVDSAPASSAEAAAARLPEPGDGVATASGPRTVADEVIAVAPLKLIKNAEPVVDRARIPKAANQTAAAEPPAMDPPTFEDNLAALIQQLTGCTPDAPSIGLLQDLVRDHDLLLECLQWMLRQPGERFAKLDLMMSQVLYYCFQAGGLYPSPFLAYRRRRKERSASALADGNTMRRG